TTLFTVNAKWPVRPPTDTHPDFRAAVAFYPGCARAVDRAWAPSVPLLILIGELDNWTPIEACRELVGQTEDPRGFLTFVPYPGAHHGFDAPGGGPRERVGVRGAVSGMSVTVGAHPESREDARKRVPAFLARYLKD